MNEWQVINAAEVWRRGFNTEEIARYLRLPERVVYNNVERIRDLARGVTP
jgi:hypothetical protein